MYILLVTLNVGSCPSFMPTDCRLLSILSLFRAASLPLAVPSDAKSCLMCLEGKKPKSNLLYICFPNPHCWISKWELWYLGDNSEPHPSPPESAVGFAGSHLTSGGMCLSDKVPCSTNGNKNITVLHPLMGYSMRVQHRAQDRRALGRSCLSFHVWFLRSKVYCPFQ